MYLCVAFNALHLCAGESYNYLIKKCHLAAIYLLSWTFNLRATQWQSLRGSGRGVWLNFSSVWQLKHLVALCVLIMIGRCRLGRYGLKAAAMFQQMLDTQTVLGSANYNYNNSCSQWEQYCSQYCCVASRGNSGLSFFFFFGVLCIFNVCLLSLCRSLLFFSLSTSHYLPFSLSLFTSVSLHLSLCAAFTACLAVLPQCWR